MWLRTKSVFPEALKSGPHHKYCLPTSHLLLSHPHVPEVIFIQPFLRCVRYCTFLYVERWATEETSWPQTLVQRDTAVSAARTFLLLYLQFLSQSWTRSACFHLLSLSQHLCWSLGLSDLAGFLAALVFHVLFQGHKHTHTHAQYI